MVAVPVRARVGQGVLPPPPTGGLTPSDNVDAYGNLNAATRTPTEAETAYRNQFGGGIDAWHANSATPVNAAAQTGKVNWNSLSAADQVAMYNASQDPRYKGIMSQFNYGSDPLGEQRAINQADLDRIQTQLWTSQTANPQLAALMGGYKAPVTGSARFTPAEAAAKNKAADQAMVNNARFMGTAGWLAAKNRLANGSY